ncbi:MAG TPA: zinc metalloprotease HtpX [Candidatus Acidoferrum sp.]|nr:zinc metalloprotease HtpX [Candidatus Acidoferrum sp.]HYW39079.1 zinc metalloprotease HtpX [Terriglobales bacterium]
MKVLRTGILLILLSVLLVLVGGALGGRGGMQIALVIAILMNGVSYFFSDKIALKSSGAQPVTREQLPRLYQVMERLAAKANIPVPKLYVVPDVAPNAFATGRNPNHASVAVTQGLLQIMNDDELEGVIAHELSHVRNYDILTSSIAATIAGAVTYMAQMGRWAMIFGGYGGSRDDDRGGGGLSALLMIFLAPFAALLLQLFLSRTREYAADETGARMVGQPYGLISALEKLGSYNRRVPTSAISPSISSLCIVRPMFGGGTLSSLFSTHPPLEDRIAALRQMVNTPLR